MIIRLGVEQNHLLMNYCSRYSFKGTNFWYYRLCFLEICNGKLKGEGKMDLDEEKLLDVKNKINGNTDLTWLEKSLEKRLISSKTVLTSDNRELIFRLIYFYEITPFDLEKAVLESLSTDHILNEIKLQNVCRNSFRFRNSDSSDGDKKLQGQTNKQKEKEEEFIEYLETITPKELIEEILSEEKVAEYEPEIFQYLMTNPKIPKPVINMLVYYVILNCDKKLVLEQWEESVSYWSKKQLRTVKEAIDLLEVEIKFSLILVRNKY